MRSISPMKRTQRNSKNSTRISGEKTQTIIDLEKELMKQESLYVLMKKEYEKNEVKKKMIDDKIKQENKLFL